ncbi:MAG: prepilin-type N-terminal cleavage/methylation domain-containing protein [Candidatus Omnitrophica bacterium]|nr:prepilin-type N-terminal cleavage/methylation domain-containing protein [Candidatus Omnitrophota bacterium]
MKDQQGLTFIEVITSMLLLTVIMAGMFQVFSLAERAVDRQSRRMTALNFSRQLMESVRSRGHFETVLQDTLALPDADADGFIDPATATGYSGEFPSVPNDPGNSFGYIFSGTSYLRIEDIGDYKKVTTKVTWNEPNE